MASSHREHKSPLLFNVGSFGRSGTVWFSKLLNSHPDVLSLHEGVMLHDHAEHWYEAGVSETIAWIKKFYDVSRWNVGMGCYRAVGDVNSVGGFHRVVPFANEFYKCTTYSELDDCLASSNLYLLTRHPVLSIESKLRLIWPLRDLYIPYAKKYIGNVLSGDVKEELGWLTSDSSSDTSLVRVMLMLHWRFVAQLRYIDYFRLEDIGGSPDAAESALQKVTGIQDGWGDLVLRAQVRENEGTVPSQSVKEVWSEWSDIERKAYGLFCAEHGLRYGYEVAGADVQMIYIPMLDRPGAWQTTERWGVSSVVSPVAKACNRVGIWGTGEFAAACLEALGDRRDVISVVFCVDNDLSRQGRRWMGVPVVSVESLVSSELDFLIIASSFQESIRTQLSRVDLGSAVVVYLDAGSAASVSSIRYTLGNCIAIGDG